MTYPRPIWETEDSSPLEWTYKSFKCSIKKAAHLGTWCGYVCVPHNHPWTPLHYDHVGAQVHGRLTFGGSKDDAGVWFGFDCAHSTDLIPQMRHMFKTRAKGQDEDESKYRDRAYVIAQTEHLADQAFAVLDPLVQEVILALESQNDSQKS